MNTPGRVCPLRYRYEPAAIARAPERSAEIRYVIGGLYGNVPALDAVETMARAEQGPVTLCFNGDFNWFNGDDAGFRAINERVPAASSESPTGRTIAFERFAAQARARRSTPHRKTVAACRAAN